MLRICLTIIFLASSILIISGTEEALPRDSERIAVESTVRGFEQATEDFDFDKANLLLAPQARWIEESLPEKADEWPEWWRKAKAAGVHITYRLRDFETHVQGNVAWVTLTIDGTFSADSVEGQKLLASQVEGGFLTLAGNAHETRDTFVESEVLVKSAQGWRIALGHTSKLPKPEE